MGTETPDELVGVAGEDGRMEKVQRSPGSKHHQPFLIGLFFFYLMYVNGFTWTFIYSSFGIIGVCMNGNEP